MGSHGRDTKLYRFAAGVARILDYAHEGCKGWFKPVRRRFEQLSFLVA